MNSSSRENSADTLIFVHIGKTAGSTFNFLIEHNFFRQNSFGAYDNRIDPKLRSSTGVFEPETVVEIVRRKEAERGRPFGFLPGHMRFGLHAHLDRPCVYVTFVRDPVERVVSAYNYVRSLGWLEDNVSLADFVKMDFLGNCNAMVRQLVDDPRLDTKANPALRSDARDVTEADFAAALSNLDQHFAVAAPLSGFDYALLLLAQHYNWPFGKLFYKPANVTPRKGPKVVVNNATRALILKRNEWDCALYEHVARQFEQRVAKLKDNSGSAGRFRDMMAAYRKTMSHEWPTEAASKLNTAFEIEAKAVQTSLSSALEKTVSA